MFTNGLSMNNSLRLSQRSLGVNMQRLSTSLRINTAKDDAAGLAISTRMGSLSGGLGVGIRNMQDGYSMLQTAEAAAGKTQNILQRIRELAVQADNGTMSASDKASIQGEIDGLLQEYDHVVNNSSFNGIQLLNNGSTISLNPGSGDNIEVTTTDMTSTAGGAIDLTGIDVTTAGGAQAAIQKIDAAIDEISSQRAKYGASMSRLERTIDYTYQHQINVEEARSRIRDADMAKEMSNLIKNKLNTQATVSMMHIRNQNDALVLNLFKL